MSHQGPLPDRDADFGLIETLLWTPEGGYALLPEHLARLAASSAALGFAHDEGRVAAALAEIVETIPHDASASPLRERGGGTGRGRFSPGPEDSATPPPHPFPASRERAQDAVSPARLRVRLVLSRDGRVETTVTPIEPTPPETLWRVAIADTRFSSADSFLRHKTTRRALYEDELARAQKSGADEVLFLNERDELCESARCNLFVPDGDVLLTPPLASGLLPGTLRARLLAEGRARECLLRLADLPGRFFLGNSVRGLTAAERASAAV
jgi:branched-subunit amino acid aminotransferase/4-amino-4-deoxychorismate lyase